MIRYVVGFAFNKLGTLVILIRKDRPPWQWHMLNGIGGHVESGESYVDAMVREFGEECGAETEVKDWVEFMTLGGNDWIVKFFYTTIGDTVQITSRTDEIVGMEDPHMLPNNCISNLYWLIPMALYHRRFPDEFKEWEE